MQSLSPGSYAIINGYEYKPLANFIRQMKEGQIALLRASE
jgi:hypothetical protein